MPGVTVVGSGYIGTVVASTLAWLGRRVIGVESDPSKLCELRHGQCPFDESGLTELLLDSLRSGRLRFTDNMTEALSQTGVVFVCVGPPPGRDGRANPTSAFAWSGNGDS
jgi:UDPglucose 6-dehydrogenase